MDPQTPAAPLPDQSVVTPVPAPAIEPAAPAVSSVERRINALFAQKKDAEDRLGAVSQENELLRAELLRLQDQAASARLSAQPAAAALEPPPVASVSGTDVGAVVSAKLKEFEASLAQRQAQERAALQLRFAQTQSLQAAVAEFPDLRDQSSPLFVLADRLIREDRGLQTSPQGPYRAVLMARGILADQGPNAAVRAAAAGGPVTGPVGTPSSSTQEAASNIAAAEAEIERIQDKQRRGEGDPAKLWTQYRVATEQLAILKGGAAK